MSDTKVNEIVETVEEEEAQVAATIVEDEDYEDDDEDSTEENYTAAEVAQANVASGILGLFTVADVKKSDGTTTNPLVSAKTKVIEAINNQIALAEEFVSTGSIAQQTKQRRQQVANGDYALVDVAYTPRPWFFTYDNKMFLNIRYGSRPIVVANGKAAIVVGSKDNLIATLQLVAEAVETGELDTAIMQARKRIRRNK